MSEIIKYKNSEILFQSVQSNNEPAAVRNMIEELNSFENEVSLLLDDMANALLASISPIFVLPFLDI